MKILRIAGKNLASLGGDFEVDLQSTPLGLVGLFAIVGPTGAGKSTLLDAMCLALYGTTPRMDAAGDTTPFDLDGRERSASDALQLMRRGTAEAYATVRFRVPTGEYEATWSVSALTRGKKKGQAGESKWSLRALPSAEVIASGVKATSEKVSELTGLTFERFGRCMLLAQGEFAAFLEANSSERAKVLEALTDSRGLYRKLSMRAQKEGAAAEQQVKAARDDIARVTVLSPAELEELEGKLAAGAKGATKAKALLDASQVSLGWWGTADAADGHVSTALAGLQTAERDFQAAEPLRQRVREVESVSSLREPMRVLDTATSEAQRAAKELQDVERQLDTQAAERANRSGKLEEAKAAATQFEQQVALARPNLEKAQELDRTLRALEEDHAKQRGLLSELEKERGQLAHRAETLEDQAGEVAQERATLDAWFQAHAAAGLLAAQRDAWLGPLTRYAKTAPERDAFLRALEDHRPEAGKAAEASQTALAAVEKARQRHDTARGEAEAAQGRADELRAKVSVDEARRQEARLRELDELKTTGGRLLELRRSRSALTRQRAEESGRQLEAQQELVTLDASIVAANAKWLALQQQEQLARQQASVEAHRKALKAGEPCVVCGSLEHPWATPAQVLSLDALTPKCEAAEQALADLRSARDARQRAATQHETRATEFSRQETQATTDLAALEASWTQLATAARLPSGEPPQEELPPALTTGRETVQADLAALQTLDAEAKRAVEEAKRLREAAGKEDLAQRAAQKDSEAAARHASESQQRVRSEEQQLLALERTLEEAWQEAVPSLGEQAHERARFVLAPHVTLEGWKALVREHEQRRGAETQLIARTVTLAGERATLERDQLLWKGKHDPLQQQVDELEATLGEARGARAALFGGRTVQSIEAEHVTRTQQLAGLCADAQAQLDLAASAFHGLEGRRNERREIVSRLKSQRTDAQTAWQAALAAQQLEEVTARLRLSTSEEELRRWVDQLAQLSLAHEKAKKVHEDHLAARKALDASKPPEDRATLTTRKAEAETRWQALIAELAVLRKDQENDAARRLQRAQLEKTLELLLVSAGVASELHSLIGHNAGDKFAEFAQALMLDQMLHAANEQLRQLQPRYALQRLDHGRPEVAGLLEMAIVDRSLGDRLRPVSTLSGGERFLVSLALALGLSAMSSEDTQLGTMFIDEGFGTLDAETLQVAMGVLDSLQQRGTQVGIISHVGDLADRITAQVRVERVDAGQGLSRVRVFPESEDRPPVSAPTSPGR